MAQNGMPDAVIVFPFRRSKTILHKERKIKVHVLFGSTLEIEYNTHF